MSSGTYNVSLPIQVSEKVKCKPKKLASRAESCRNLSSTFALRILRSAKVPSHVWEFNAEFTFTLEGSSKKINSASSPESQHQSCVRPYQDTTEIDAHQDYFITLPEST